MGRHCPARQWLVARAVEVRMIRKTAVLSIIDVRQMCGNRVALRSDIFRMLASHVFKFGLLRLNTSKFHGYLLTN